MPKYVVAARELKWRGKSYLRNAGFPVEGDREVKQAELLVKIGRAAVVPEPKPIRKVAETRPAPAPEPVPEAAPEAIEAPIPASTADGFVDESAAVSPGRYRTRRLKSED